MATQLLPLPPLPPQPSSGRFVRIEYVDFQNVAEHREFRLRAYLPEGSAEFRFRIAVAAFDARRVRLQDGPDVCYQKLLRAVAAGETPGRILDQYPSLKPEHIPAAIGYAADLARERIVPIPV